MSISTNDRVSCCLELLSTDASLDPNERCAVVTLALALIVCPHEVERNLEYLWTIKYRAIKVTIYSPEQKPSIHFSVWSSFGNNDSSLAQTYGDHENNVASLRFLRALKMCTRPEEKAVVYGLAWVCLTSGYRSVSFSFNVSPVESSGEVLENSKYGLYLRRSGSEILEARYTNATFPPGIQ
jgi:hypothetical protein